VTILPCSVDPNAGGSTYFRVVRSAVGISALLNNEIGLIPECYLSSC